MQLQIECNAAPLQKQQCLICGDLFETAAKVIICNNQGKSYGEVCPHCLKEGFHWLSERFNQINQAKRIENLHSVQKSRMVVGLRS